jgi:hypothetical protein
MLTEADRVEGTTRHEDGVTGDALGRDILPVVGG